METPGKSLVIGVLHAALGLALGGAIALVGCRSLSPCQEPCDLRIPTTLAVPGRVSDVAFSSSGWLAATTDTAGLHAWALPCGESIGFAEPLGDNATSATFSADGAWLATGTRAGGVRVWFPPSWDRWIDLEPNGTGRATMIVAASPDGRCVVAGGANGFLRAWDIESGRRLYNVRAHSGPVTALAIDPRQRWVLTGCSGPRERTLRGWDFRTGAELIGMVAMKGETVPPPGVAHASLAPDGQMLVALLGGEIHEWVVAARTLEHMGVIRHNGTDVTCCAMSPDGRWLAAGHRDGAIDVLDLRRRVWVQGLAAGVVSRHHAGAVSAIAWACGTAFVSGSDDGVLLKWNVREGP